MDTFSRGVFVPACDTHNDSQALLLNSMATRTHTPKARAGWAAQVARMDAGYFIYWQEQSWALA